MKKPRSKTKVGDNPAYETVFELPFAPMPTTEQLARLAASLANNLDEDPANLVEYASALWNASAKKTQPFILDHEFPDFFTAADTARDGKIARDTFFIRFMAPSMGKRQHEVADTAKAYLAALLEIELKRAPSTDEVNEKYSTWNAGVPQEANRLAFEFLNWHREFIRDTRRKAGLKSVAAKLSRQKAS